MKKSELLQLAIDKHLAMTQDESLNGKFKYLCGAVCRAGLGYGMNLTYDVKMHIESSIKHRPTFNGYLANELQVNNPFPSDTLPEDAAKFEFIQFLRKKHAEFLIQQLQAKGE